MAVSVNRKRADRSGKSLLYVGVKSNGRVASPRLALPNAVFRAPDSESLPEACSSPASIDSMPTGLVSLVSNCGLIYSSRGERPNRVGESGGER
jgi:hypothetical protein